MKGRRRCRSTLNLPIALKFRDKIDNLNLLGNRPAFEGLNEVSIMGKSTKKDNPATPVKDDAVTAEENTQALEVEETPAEDIEEVAPQSDVEEKTDVEEESKPRKSKEEKISEWIDSLEADEKAKAQSMIESISAVKNDMLSLPMLKNVYTTFSLKDIEEIVDPDSEGMWLRIHKRYLNISKDAKEIEKESKKLTKDIEGIEAKIKDIEPSLLEDAADYEEAKSLDAPGSRDLKFIKYYELQMSELQSLQESLESTQTKLSKLSSPGDDEKPTPEQLIEAIASTCHMVGGIDEFLGQQALVSLKTPSELRSKKSKS